MAGRRPKPMHLHLVQGTTRTDRHKPDGASQPPRTVPAPPSHLSRYAREAWGSFAPLLSRMGILTPADALALERLCDCYSEIRECQLVIEIAGGPTYETRNVAGERMYRSRPEAAKLADADRRFRAWLIEFGLTPAARTKVKADGARTADPLDKYFQ